MNKYTVLLLRPEHIANDYGRDTYCAHVTADNPAQAAEAAQQEVSNVDRQLTDEMDPNDYAVVFLCEGWQDDLTGVS